MCCKSRRRWPTRTTSISRRSWRSGSRRPISRELSEVNEMGARGAVLIGLICLSDLSAGCRQSAAVAAALLTPVGVSAIGTRDVGNRTPYSAGIVPYSQVDLAFKSGGYVESILQVRGADGRMRNIQEGDWVARGTVLARVRESDYVANVNATKAQLAQARAALAQARLALDRTPASVRAQSVTRPP